MALSGSKICSTSKGWYNSTSAGQGSLALKRNSFVLRTNTMLYVSILPPISIWSDSEIIPGAVILSQSESLTEFAFRTSVSLRKALNKAYLYTLFQCFVIMPVSQLAADARKESADRGVI